jgi:hypothetical protein
MTCVFDTIACEGYHLGGLIQIMKKFVCQFSTQYFMIVLLLMSISSLAIADQVIYIDLVNAANMESESQFGIEVDGNTWLRFSDPTALNGTGALGDPGDNDSKGAKPPGAPFLVYKFPVEVNPGESTAEGKEWVPWAHMRVPDDFNSFFWQVSIDKVTWKPADNSPANRWNDDAVNKSNAWYWQDNVTGNAGGIPADIEVGVNYFRLGVREADPEKFSFIDVVCFRNDGQAPTDEEALSSGTAVEPVGKLATSWARVKAGVK